MKKWVLPLVFSILCSGAQGLLANQAQAEEEKILNVYAWSEYLPQESLEAFEDKYGIKVVYSTYDSNEAMYAKLKLLDGKGYDLVIPSTYFIAQMRDEGMLAKIDKTKLSNFNQIKKHLIGLEFDPDNEYSIFVGFFRYSGQQKIYRSGRHNQLGRSCPSGVRRKNSDA